MRLVLLLVLALAGSAHAQAPAARAKAIIETQRPLLDKGVVGAQRLLGQMDPDGIVVGAMSVETPKEMLAVLSRPEAGGDELHVRNALHSLFWYGIDPAISPPKNIKQTVKSTVGNLVAGGRADAVWFTFDLAVDRFVPDLGGRPYRSNNTFRITELAVDRGGWKVVLFHIDIARPDTWDDLLGAGGGPPEGERFTDTDSSKEPTVLAEVAYEPAKLAKALLVEPSTIVVGSSASDRGVGAAALKLVKRWSKLKLEASDSLERTSKTWGFSVVRLDLDGKNEDQKMRMFASVIALPKADGTWQVVTVRYSRINSM